MGRRKSKIVPKEPSRDVPKPRLLFPTRKALREFSQKATLRITPIRSCGPKVRGHVSVASWQVEVVESHQNAWQQVAEQYGNVATLFHGTPSYNVANITVEGLKTGGSYCMFGPGIYFGYPEKAIGYTGRNAPRAMYLFEADVVLGKSKEPPSSEKCTLTKLRAEGFQSVHGRAGGTASWAGTLRYDEWVVYSPDQVLLRKLHEYQPTHEMPVIRPKTGPCALFVNKDVVISKKARAFQDVISQQQCSRTGSTEVRVDHKGHFSYVWVCHSCIADLKLRVGSKVHIRPSAWSGIAEVRIVKQP